MITATIPVALLEAANAHLDLLGFGPGSFSVAMKASGEMATHGGLSCWDIPEFKAALDEMVASGDYPGLSLGDNFEQQAAQQALDWSDPTNWVQNPVMTGDQRNYGGKLWESLLDYNVWAPPVGWREVVQQGYPAWVQPTGAHDAYPIGFEVQHDNPNDGGALWRYSSNIAANTTQPGRDGTFDRWWRPVNRISP